jgi:hypothetical protein
LICLLSLSPPRLPPPPAFLHTPPPTHTVTMSSSNASPPVARPAVLLIGTGEYASSSPTQHPPSPHSIGRTTHAPLPRADTRLAT